MRCAHGKEEIDAFMMVLNEMTVYVYLCVSVHAH